MVPSLSLSVALVVLVIATMHPRGVLRVASAVFLFFTQVTPSSHPPFKSHGGSPIARTQSGTLIRGIVDSDNPLVSQFLGIPYAAPPVGPLRWGPPQPAAHVAEVKATELPKSCMQYASNGSSVYTRDVLEFSVPGGNDSPMGEDCLTISVWTPVWAGWKGGRGRHKTKKDGGLPVMMFIYGGAFQTGGENVPYQIPAQWVQRSQNLIVVSFKYAKSHNQI